jgi:hypothetical protein
MVESSLPKVSNAPSKRDCGEGVDHRSPLAVVAVVTTAVVVPLVVLAYFKVLHY